MELRKAGYRAELDETDVDKQYTIFAPVNRAMEQLQTTTIGRKYLDPLYKGSRIVSKRTAFTLLNVFFLSRLQPTQDT